MTREDVQDFLAMVQATYPNYNPPSRTAAVNAWTMALEEYDKDQIAVAFKVYMQTSTSGFAPTPGQLIDKIQLLTQPQEMNEQEAWSLVYKAICNSSYNSVDEFAKLPPIVQKAVGQPSQLREWALMDSFNSEVAMSSFERSYKMEIAREKELQKMPSSIRQLIEDVNKTSHKAQIATKNAEMIKISSEEKQNEIKSLEESIEQTVMSKETEDKLNEVMEELKNS